MDLLARAENTAAAMLGRKALTCRELSDKLSRKGFEQEMINQVIERFLQVGYLDDARYAELYLADAVRLGAKGIFRIRQELFKKGIAASVIQEAIEKSEIDVEEALKTFIEQHRLPEAVHCRRDLEKLKARLARRGYSPAEISRALSEYNFCFEEDREYLD